MTLGIFGWALWRQPPRVSGYVVLIAVSAGGLTTVAATTTQFSVHHLGLLAALTVMAIVQAEWGRHIERSRQTIQGTVYVSVASAWLVPAVLLLPLPLVAAHVVILVCHRRARSTFRPKPVHRTVGTIAVIIVTCAVTRLTMATTGVADGRQAVNAGWAGVAAITVAVATFFVVNAVLIVPFLAGADHSMETLFGSWAENLLELAALCLGALTAVVLAVLPPLAVLALPTLYVVHRAALITQLESAARRDSKTGVWNAAGWHRMANHELAHTRGTFGLLMIDLDQFKQINGTYGHLAGDTVLQNIADTITATVRRQDSVGRFGGDEFLVLLPDSTESDIRAVAERIRSEVSQLTVTCHDQRITGLSVSIGIATYPTSGTTIGTLIEAADAAMYEAKTNGRNQVASSTDPAASR